MPDDVTPQPEPPVVIINAPNDAPPEPIPAVETEPTIEQRFSDYMAECERRFGEHDERLRNLERPAGAGDTTETPGPETPQPEPNGDTPPEPEPERPPNATHWYFKRIGE